MNLFSSSVFLQWLMLAYEFLDLICLSQDLQGNIASVLEADVGAGWALCFKLERMVSLQLLS